LLNESQIRPKSYRSIYKNLNDERINVENEHFVKRLALRFDFNSKIEI